MNLRVDRDIFTAKSTGGKFSILGDDFRCYTLEPVSRQDDVKPRAIPVGTYRVTLRWSPKHGRMIPHVEDVHNFAEIEIHIGNFPQDTEGCLLVGSGREANKVTGSHGTFDALFDLMAKEAGLPADQYLKYTDKVYEVGSITYANPPTGLEQPV